jgi:hypothetical protein
MAPTENSRSRDLSGLGEYQEILAYIAVVTNIMHACNRRPLSLLATECLMDLYKGHHQLAFHEQYNVFPTRSNGKQTPKDSMHVTVS